MAFGRVALVGDAAFVVRPHVGGGIVKAAQDAAALAAALDRHSAVAAGTAGLTRPSGWGSGGAMSRQARRLGSYLKHRFDNDEERARAAFHAEPEQVLAETALLDFMREG